MGGGLRMHFPYPLETAYNSIYRKKFLDLSLFTPWKLCKIVSHSLEVPRPKTKRRLWNFHMSILQYPWNSINDTVMIIFLQYTILFLVYFQESSLKAHWPLPPIPPPPPHTHKGSAEPVAELTAPQDTYLHFTTYKNSIFVKKWT